MMVVGGFWIPSGAQEWVGGFWIVRDPNELAAPVGIAISLPLAIIGIVRARQVLTAERQQPA